MRLQKYLAVCGVASRRKSEELIKRGIIKVNGKVVTQMGYKIQAGKDIITIKDQLIELERKKIYVLLNKPNGYITTVSDEFNRNKVTDLVDLPYRLFPVGRLDYNTSGLLLLTNDGQLTFKLTHPKFGILKTYIAEIKGMLDDKKIKAFERGIMIDNYITQPAKIRIIRKLKNNSIVEISISEGRNRQIRKMCKAIGNPVISLQRIAMGNLKLNELPIGSWRYLTDGEVDYLKNL